MIKIKSRLKNKKNQLHLDGGVLVKSKYSNLVVLFTGKTDGIVMWPDFEFELFEKYNKWNPYYNSTYWEILPKNTELKINIQQKGNNDKNKIQVKREKN